MTTSSNDPDEIRAEIERTRANLSTNVDALTDKVSPGQIAHRQTEKVKDAVSGVKEKIFGSSDDDSSGRVHGVTSSVRDSAGSVAGSARDTAGSVAHSARDTAGSVAQSARQAPHQVKAKAEGNPLAAGLIAFGVGLLASSLIPASRKERELATQVKESQALQSATEGAKGLAREVGENLKEPARQAVEEVKGTATEGAQEVKQTAAQGAQDVKSEAQSAKDDVAGHAQESASTVRESRESGQY